MMSELKYYYDSNTISDLCMDEIYDSVTHRHIFDISDNTITKIS